MNPLCKKPTLAPDKASALSYQVTDLSKIAINTTAAIGNFKVSRTIKQAEPAKCNVLLSLALHQKPLEESQLQTPSNHVDDLRQEELEENTTHTFRLAENDEHSTPPCTSIIPMEDESVEEVIEEGFVFQGRCSYSIPN